jgi:hypothetical protein
MTFCGYCGKTVEKESVPQCDGCDAMEYIAYCPRCGKRIEDCYEHRRWRGGKE